MDSRKIVAGICCSLLAVILLISWLMLHPAANVSIVVAPDTANLTLETGKHVPPGKIHLAPGKHTVIAKLAGFSTVSQAFITPSKGITTVTLLLNPVDAEGFTYLQNHPDQEQKREAIGGQRYDQSSQALHNSTSLLKLLPYIGPGLEFRIDYGTETATSQPIIYITGATTQAQQDGLTWIKNQGFDTSKLNIQYITSTV